MSKFVVYTLWTENMTIEAPNEETAIEMAEEFVATSEKMNKGRLGLCNWHVVEVPTEPVKPVRVPYSDGLDDWRAMENKYKGGQ